MTPSGHGGHVHFGGGWGVLWCRGGEIEEVKVDAFAFVFETRSVSLSHVQGSQHHLQNINFY